MLPRLPWENNTHDLPIAQHIAARTAQAIVEQTQPPGSFLTEVELASTFQASRTPAREAMLQLERWGLVQLMPKKGAHVTTLSVAEITDLSAVRTMFEIDAVTHFSAAPHTDPTLSADLHTLLDQQRTFLKTRDALSFAATDYAFHARLIYSGKNTIVMQLLANLGPRLARLTHHAAITNPHLMDKYFTEHEQLAACAQTADVEAFAALTRQHIYEAHFPRESSIR